MHSKENAHNDEGFLFFLTEAYLVVVKIFIYTLFFISLVSTLGAQVNIDSIYSQETLEKLLKTARIEQDHEDLADVYFLLAQLEENKNSDYEKSFEYYTRSLEYYKIGDNISQVHEIQKKIAKSYARSELYSEAISIYNELLEYYSEKKHLKTRTLLLNDLAKVHGLQGDLEMEYNYLNQAIRLNRILKDTLLEIDFLFDRIKNYQKLNELDSAIMLSFESFQLSKALKNVELESNSLYYIGKLNKLKRNYPRALKYLKASLERMPEQAYNVKKRDSYKDLSEVYSKLNLFDTAYVYSQMYAYLNDSILNKDRLESINKLTIKYETREKKSAINLLEKEKAFSDQRSEQKTRALYVMGIGLALLLLLMYYFIRFYTQKIKAGNIINLQKQEINQQRIRELEDNVKIKSMNSMIEGQEVERERIAKDLHDSLGGILSAIKLQFDGVEYKVKNITKVNEYKRATKMLDNAVEEVRNISRNLQPTALRELGLVSAIKDLINRFSGERYPEIDFQYYNVPENLDRLFALSLYRIIQELLHNTIKHAQASEIIIQINRQDDELVVSFEDDGIGFNPDRLKRKGMGLDNIKSRVNYLKGTLSIDSEIGKGSSFIINVKY